jgi:hypothetical protein
MLRPEGTLLVVKPNLHDALDVDLLSYAASTRPFRTNPPATSPSTRRSGKVTTGWARTSDVS